MPDRTADRNPPPRSPSWKWWVCFLLLLATMLNYMDRIALNQTADRIMKEFKMGEAAYGDVQSAFGVAFALGSLLVGALADRLNVFWLYPAALAAWSAAGFATGFVTGPVGLLCCRFLLGLAEAGNWPCGLRTTQRLLPPEERTLGNGLLQSGAAIGAIITPLVVLAFLHWTDTWRYPFLVIGAAGTLWAVLWLNMVRREDLALPAWETGPGRGLEGEGYWRAWLSILSRRRFWVLVVLVISINLAWHFFLAWLPLFLQRGRGYTEDQTQWFTSAYFIAADLGSLGAGFLTLGLVRRGWALHRSRLVVFLGFALLAALSVVAAVLPRGPLLLGVLLVVGFGSLGVFPNYYALNQEISFRHQGKVNGMLGCACWLAVALLHHQAGRVIEATGSYTLGVALAGLTPLVGFAALALFWKEPVGGAEALPSPGIQPAAVSVGVRPPHRHEGQEVVDLPLAEEV